MRPRSFDYYSPATLEEALELLRTKEDAKLLAGGQSLIPLMKLRLVAFKNIIDMGRIPGLSYIRELPDGSISIGALTTHDDVENSKLIRERYPILSDAAGSIGDQQIRNLGTIGGSLAHADPSADLPPAVVALGAKLVAVGPSGKRVIDAKDFFIGPYTTALDPHEILTEIVIPNHHPGTVGAYLKLSRRHGDFAIVGAAALLTLEGEVCKDARLVFGAVGPVPHEAFSAEKVLSGSRPTDGIIQKAAELAPEGSSPPSDIHGSSEYRKEMVKVMCRRAVKAALSRAEQAKEAKAG